MQPMQLGRLVEDLDLQDPPAEMPDVRDLESHPVQLQQVPMLEAATRKHPCHSRFRGVPVKTML